MKNLTISFTGLLLLLFMLQSCTKENPNAITKNNVVNNLKSTLIDLPPSVPGEFYSYSVQFSPENPLYYMRSCKANKDAPPTYSEIFSNELDLVFVFNDGVKLCSPNSVSAISLIDNSPNVNNTEIKIANISIEEFNNIYNQMDKNLVELAFNNGTSTSTENITENMIFSVKTAQNEFGLVLIKSINNLTVSIDACHFKN